MTQKNSLKLIRRTLAVLFFAAISLLFLDFTGTLHSYLGWMAKIQFLPALLAINVGVVIGLILLTLLFGRVYCSIICPLGVMQDLFTWMGGKAKKNRFSYSPAKSLLRYIVLGVFVLCLLLGFMQIVVLIEPYSAFGRILSSIISPIYVSINNLLAGIAESAESYALYEKEVWLKSVSTLVVAILTLVAIGFLAWKNGRTWCNTICPVGTILGFISRFSLFKVMIDTDKCNSCGLCAKNCKAACINSAEHKIDHSRCVACMDCINKCNKGALQFVPRYSVQKQQAGDASVDESRRGFVKVSSILLAGAALDAQAKKVDGGLAAIEDKVVPNRQVSPKPAGAASIKNFTNHCTACQLCVQACPNGVLRPSTDLNHFMQPEMSFERGYCRPECNKCSEACPAGAIRPISIEEKSSIQIGHAVWIKENCIVETHKDSCGNCARHCPVGAILMVPKDSNDPDSLKIPVVNIERCIGCGACENLCPARPLSAIYVEGHDVHREI